jgi:hypothetical protein
MKWSNATKWMLAPALVLGLMSCKKDNDTPPLPDAAQQLTAKEWRMERVAEVHSGQPETVVYQRGAAGNQEDFSAVRQRFNASGSLSYTDENGFSGDNARWELLDNAARLKITFGGYGVTFEQFTIGNGRFSYKTPGATATDYVCFTFTHVP